jgi:hypothetical protein
MTKADKAMLDTLFCCYIIVANVRQAGYFARATDSVRRLAVWCRALRDQAMKRHPARPRGSRRPLAKTAVDCAFRNDWIERLARLESHLAAMTDWSRSLPQKYSARL